MIIVRSRTSCLYATSTAFYNKINENYRTLIDQNIIRPASILKRKISQLDTNGTGRLGYRNSGRGRGRGRGRFGGRGREGGNRGCRHGLFTPNDNSFIANIPHDIDINGSLSFPDDKWKNFTPQQKTAIQALRRHKQQCRQVAVIHSDLINQRSTSTNPSQELVTLPPVPAETATPRPEASSTSSS